MRVAIKTEAKVFETRQTKDTFSVIYFPKWVLSKFWSKIIEPYMQYFQIAGLLWIGWAVVKPWIKHILGH